MENKINIKQIKKGMVGGAMSFFVRTMVVNGIGLAANLILGGLLAVTDFGVYGVVIQIIGILTFFSDVGLASALIQRKDEPKEKDYQTIFWVQMFLAWVIVGVCWGIVQLGIFAEQLGEHGPAILYALAFSFVIVTFKTVPSIKLTRALNFGKFVWPQIIEQIVFNGLLIVLVLAGMGLPAYTVAIWLRSIAGTGAMLYLSPFWPKLVFSWGSFKQSIKYGVKFQANDLLARIKDQLFYLFVAKRVSLADFGMISFAKNWSMYPYNLTVQNIMSITFPTFSRLQEHKVHLARAIEKSIFFITVTIFPILVGMCLFFYPLTQVIEAYHQWEGALLSFVCFTLSIAPVAISNPLINVLNATGKINKTLGLMVLWTLMTWGLTLPLIAVIGFNGVAVSALAISLTSFLPVVMVKREVPFRLGEQVWRQAVASVAMVIGCVPLMSVWTRGLSYTILGGVMALGIYGGVLWLTGSKKVKAELKSLRG